MDVSDSEEVSSGIDPQTKKRKHDSPDEKAPASKKYFDEEADESSGSESGDSEPAAEEDGGDDYEYDGFVVHDEEVDGESGSKTRKKRPKPGLKRITKKITNIVDEEDYELIRDNEKSFKEIDRGDDNNSADDRDFNADEDGLDNEDGDNGNRILKPSMYDEYEDDDMSDFIEDEFANEGEADGDALASAKPKQRPVKKARVRTGPTTDQLKDAADIFGDGFDDFDDENDAMVDDEYEDEGLPEEERLKKSKDKLRQKYDRSVLVENFCTEQDDLIRQTDRPERLQYVVDRSLSEKDIEEEANWMSQKLFDWMKSSSDSADQSSEDFVAELKQSCKYVLQFYYVEHLEVPFIATYRRDYLHPSLKSKHIWKLLEFDAIYHRMNEIRERLVKVITAVGDAARSSIDSRSNWVLESRERRKNISVLRQYISRLELDLQMAEEDHEAALKVVDQRDEDATAQERALVETSASHVAKLQASLEEQSAILQENLESYEVVRSRQNMSSRYRPEAAAEVFRLFPHIRYESMIAMAADEVELRDVSDFLSLLLKGSETQKAKPKAASNAAAVVQVDSERERKAAQAAVADSLFGADNEFDDDEDEDYKPRQYKTVDGVGLINEDTAPDASSAAKDDENDDEMEFSNTTVANLHKISSGKNTYVKLKQIPSLRVFAERIAVPVSDFGDSLRNGFNAEPPPTPYLGPQSLAVEYVDGVKLVSVESVLHGVMQILSTEISSEPSVKQFCRFRYRQRATVSTRPTQLGESTINPFHEYFGIHYLEEKPIQQFMNGSSEERVLFLRLLEAEKLGLITVTINPPVSWADGNSRSGRRVLDIEHFVQLFTHFLPTKPAEDEADPVVRSEWDTFRKAIIQRALERIIIPQLHVELKRDLIRLAKEAVFEQIRDSFSSQLAKGPFVPKSITENRREYTTKLLRSCPGRPFPFSVASIFQESNNNFANISIAFVDKDGILRQHTVLPGKAGMEKLKEKLLVFLVDNKPDCIVLNASGGKTSRNTKMMLEKTILPEVSMIIARAQEERDYYDDDDDDTEPYSAHVAIISDELAKLFKNSTRAKKLFPDLEAGTAAAVCLARYAQEPLAEYCALWTSVNAVEGFGYESMYLDLHPLKHLIRGSKTQMMGILEKCLVDAVCAVGVDINRTVSQDHYAPLLAFVGGLGLRKADSLRREINRSIKLVDSRDILLTKKLLGANVYTNAAGFLKISSDSLDMNINPLDSTRVHPECYNTHKFTYKLFAASQDIEFSTLSDKRYVELTERQFDDSRQQLLKRLKDQEWVDAWTDGVAPSTYQRTVQLRKDGVERVERKTLDHELDDKLSVMILDQYADLLLRDYGRRRLQLEAIKQEVRYPWLDTRLPMKQVEDEDLFSVITGESDYSLYVGLKLGCTVMEISDFVDRTTGRRRQRAFVSTDNQLKGFIGMYDIVDESIRPDTFDISKYLQVGQRIVAVVVGVNKRNFSVDLSIKPSLVARTEDRWLEMRRDDRSMQRWYGNIGKNPSKLFDAAFLESEALRKYAEAEGLSTNINGSQGGYGSSEFGAQSSATKKASLPVTRSVQHPLFRNCDYREAEDWLKYHGVAGDILVRPSSKGPDKLAITWAFQIDMFKHIDVEERGRKPGSASLGNELIILEADMSSKTFDDLDQIYQLYILPMNDFVTSMLAHRSFKKGTVESCHDYLRTQREEHPKQIPYCIGFEPGKAGCFALMWMSLNAASTQPFKKEIIYVRPNGFKLKNETFARPSDLLSWFKKALVAAMTAPAAAPSQVPVADPSHRRSNLFNRAATSEPVSYGGSSIPPPPVPPGYRR